MLEWVASLWKPCGGVLALVAIIGLSLRLALAGEAIPEQPEDLRIIVTRDSIRVGAAVLCSISALRETLASESKTTILSIEAAVDVRAEVLVRLTETVRALGFTEVKIKALEHDGWTLYPPSPPNLESTAAMGASSMTMAANEQLQPTPYCSGGAHQARRASLRPLRAVSLSWRG